jgi:hypothetical protein
VWTVVRLPTGTAFQLGQAIKRAAEAAGRMYRAHERDNKESDR